MKQRMAAIWLTAAWVLLGPCAASAQPGQYRVDPRHSSLAFFAKSTLHRFEGTTRDVSGRLVFDPDQGAMTGPAEIRIPVAALSTGLGKRDRAMRAMFEADRYPDIRVVIERAVRLAHDRYELEGQATIRDVTQPVRFTVTTEILDDAIDASGEMALTTTMFHLKPPSVIGLIRVAPDIVVRFRTRWKRVQ